MKKENWLKKDDVRKAYFTGKLTKYLAEVQAIKGLEESDLNELKSYLDELRAEDINIARSLQLEVDSDEVLIPDDVLEENLSPEQQLALDNEKKECELSRKLAEKMINNVSKRILMKKPPKKEEVMDTALSLLGLTHFIDRETIFRERLFKKKVIEYVKQGIQRKEAEDYAKMSQEYRDFQLSEKLAIRIKEFIMMAKKIFDKDNY